MIYAYPCELTPDEEGNLTVTFPDVPEAITGGKDRTEALMMAEDALATALAGYVHAQWEIPTTSQPGAGQELVAVSRSTLIFLVRSRTCHRS
ncbi:MAG: type II toxin-antitoxin system HicB family antitoxin [Caldilineaceae bacterium SB0661_bin_32]|uniref:Type II toxin-antitoxin system HicB family antitoxin n=1 Tax=Caldilineaceae bacterium SB0661_bin_32 TaxID=2605255 RepID=A0A6B1D316_9CHLR|nr:type II toxin-antitoxin system HicB family antitoxin [Caldilineaceae bacterium SB0661_bin_32]